ncbi:lipase PLAT LH2 family [Chlorella sorokiniana]|uniref:Lipase PLAT LH2 family n=1 Tax=Chlorella sorokiniana TaxID=3076 RepID=A0A2P6TMN5_CHLSO|nr:lipase PLAT LH2 family [Chlorella sorokiniana]|eukprot:PRW45591.1 lipase PLAT LH2 family [Chlorella sorokiniana]
MRMCDVSARCRSAAAAARRHVITARGGERRAGGGGSGGTQRFTPPERLLSVVPGAEQGRKDTVYTLRLSTGLQRGSALTDPTGGVLVCLVGADGSALLHRVSRLNDPDITEQEVRDICASIDDKDAGANCAVALHQAASRRQAGAGPRLRFQEGAVDEVSFRAPELGPLSALLVGPEGGCWVCEEVDVSSSRTGHTDRFVCREALGEGGREAAGYLRPVPPGAVVYGSGDSSVIVTKEQAAALYRLNMEQYTSLKGQLLAATAVLVGLGSALAYAAGGRDLALPFALGGVSGMLYQYMLQAAADSVGTGGTPNSYAAETASSGLALRLSLVNPGVRIGLAAGSFLGIVLLLQGLSGSGEEAASAPQLFQVQQIAAALVGFLCYKAAVVGVAIIPPPLDDERSLLAQADAGGNGSGRARGDGPRD